MSPGGGPRGARAPRLVVVRPAKELPWAPRPGTHNEAFAADED